MARSVTILLPTFNEMENEMLPAIADRLREWSGRCEVICVDGGSLDGTVEYLKEHCLRTLVLPRSSRAQRLNAGVVASSGSVLLLHHPRSLIENEGVEYLLEAPALPAWGAFTHCFDFEHPLLRFTSWYSNEVRLKRVGIAYLDHCIFYERRLLPEAHPVPELDVFEDTALSSKLKKLEHPKLLPFRSRTSAIRFRRNGLFKQSVLNQVLKVGYHLGVPAPAMRRLYERGLSLNQ